MSALQNEIGRLSATEKLELLDVLWQSLYVAHALACWSEFQLAPAGVG